MFHARRALRPALNRIHRVNALRTRSFASPLDSPPPVERPPIDHASLMRDAKKHVVLLLLGIVSGGIIVNNWNTEQKDRLQNTIREVEAPGSVFKVAFTGAEGPQRKQLVECIAARLRATGEMDVYNTPSVDSMFKGFTNQAIPPDYWEEGEIKRLHVYRNAHIKLQNALETSAIDAAIPSQHPTVVLFDGCMVDVLQQVPIKTLAQIYYDNKLSFKELTKRYDLVVRFEDGPIPDSLPYKQEKTVSRTSIIKSVLGEHSNVQEVHNDFDSDMVLDIIRTQVRNRRIALEHHFSSIEKNEADAA